MWINGVGRDQLTGTVNNRHLHAGTQAGIEAHGGAQAGRSRHQQVMQVTGKDIDCFIFRAFAHGAHQFGFEVHQHLNSPCPAHNAFTPAVCRCVVQSQAKVILNDLLAVALFRWLIELRIGIQRKLKHALVTATEHGQRTVGWHGRDRFVVIEVVAEFRAFIFFTAYHGGNQMRVLPQVVTHFRQQRGIFSEAFHQDVTCAVEGRFGIRHAVVGVEIFSGFCFRVVRRLVPQQVCQRLKACFNGDLSTGTAFRFVRQIEIFEFGLT